MKTIVVSGVNIRKGGTLTILNDCLRYLSDFSKKNSLRIIAIVHKKELCAYPGIEYIEIPNSIKSWGRRLWNEYIHFHKLSKKIGHIDLWLSMHDTTPRVNADIQVTYCQTSFPFYNWKWHDFKMDYKIPLFAMFTRFAYKVNINNNKHLIVQQQWLRDGLSKLLNVAPEKFIVFPPEKKHINPITTDIKNTIPTFLYASSADCHKNFEILCQATHLLENEIGLGKFQTLITISGTENRYAKYLKKEWGSVNSLKFVGFQPKDKLYELYNSANCLVFPSKVETWGLPISEYSTTGKPMILADLPYAHETASGCNNTIYFNPNDASELKLYMQRICNNDVTFLSHSEHHELKQPAVTSWDELFKTLLNIYGTTT